MAAIRAYTGNPGSGKTYNMVADARPYIGRVKIYSNFHAMPLPGKVEPWAEYIDSWEEVAGVRRCLLLLDEAHVWFAARDYRNFARDMGDFFTQHRKQDVTIWFTTQHIEYVDTYIRKITSEVWECSRWLGRYFVLRGRNPLDSGKHKYYGTRCRKFSQAVADMYDTYEVIGGRDGGGGCQGAGAMRQETECAVNYCLGHLVREQEDPLLNRVQYRRVTPSDLMGVGVDIVDIGGNGRG